MSKYKNIIFILLVFTSVSVSQIKWELDYNSANFGILILDYNKYTFQNGCFSKFKYYPEYDRNGIPFTIVYNSPIDYGNILFTYKATKDTLFAADIWWAGTGRIKYPKVFEDANQFTFDSTITMLPYSFDYLQYMTEISNELYRVKADSAWKAIKKLSILKKFAEANSVFRVGLYLYAPAVGKFRPDLAKWIIFLYRGQIITGIHNEKIVPSSYSLFQNFPNPFNPTTRISYSVPRSSYVSIKVYDILSREVATIVNENKLTGNYNIQFNAAKLTSGVYFYRMQAGDFVQTKKLILLK